MSDDPAPLATLRAELAAERARLRALEALIDHVPGLFIEIEVEPGKLVGETVHVGGDVERMLGFTREEMRGMVGFWGKLLHPDDAARVHQDLASLHAEGRASVKPHRLRRKDGSHIWLEAHFLLTPGEGGARDRLTSLAFDVTPRMAAKQQTLALLQEERVLRKRLDGFVSSVPGVVWESYFDPDQRLHQADYVSDQIEALSGYAPDEWKQPGFWLTLVHPEDREMAEAASRAVIAQGSGSVTYRWITKGGATLWVTNQMVAIRDDAGQPVGMRGITMDVTDLHAAETAREEARVREEVLRAQQEGLLALSTPLVPIDDDVLAMPLVGALDARRAERILQTLLEGVQGTGARAVILDVTGVPMVDVETAEGILRAAKAVELLGAEVVLTGVRADVARTLVALGADLGRIVTRATLKAGIAHAKRGLRDQ
jgi:PAS domain S-box-containing protein